MRPLRALAACAGIVSLCAGPMLACSGDDGPDDQITRIDGPAVVDEDGDGQLDG